MSPARAGFCGLGKMGAPMARRLADAGHAVHVWNRSPAGAQALAAQAGDNCSVCATPADVARNADLVMLCLTDGAAVESVVFGPQGLASGASAATTLVDHSSIAPALTQALAARWREATGGAWIDAPVSGGTAGAQAGTLAIMAGGDAAAVDAAAPVLAAYAARVTRMGDVGAGQATKLANQTIVASTIAAIAEAVMLAQRSDIDAARMPDALRGGWADSVLLQTLLPRMLTPPVQASGTIRVMLKDLDTVQEMARERGAALAVAGTVRRWLARAVAAGYGDADISQIVQVPFDD